MRFVASLELREQSAIQYPLSLVAASNRSVLDQYYQKEQTHDLLANFNCSYLLFLQCKTPSLYYISNLFQNQRDKAEMACSNLTNAGLN